MTSEKSGREPIRSDLVTGSKRDNALTCRHRTSLPYRKRYEQRYGGNVDEGSNAIIAPGNTQATVAIGGSTLRPCETRSHKLQGLNDDFNTPVIVLEDIEAMDGFWVFQHSELGAHCRGLFDEVIG